MKIAILDDYQNATATLDCYNLLREHEVKVFNNTTKGLGQLAIRLAPFDALVLIRERTTLNRALLNKLPNLKLISQTGVTRRPISNGLPSASHKLTTILPRRDQNS